MTNLPKNPDPNFTVKQKKAFVAMRNLLLDDDLADKAYNKLPESDSGKIISSDIARHLDTDYAKASAKSKDMAPSWDLAWRYAQDRFEREISNKGKRKQLRLMSGGWGAGKTFALRNEPTIAPNLVWDGTLGDQQWAIQMIDYAIENKWRVEIAYVYRDIELALYGAIQRKQEIGRGVPLEKLTNVHREAQQSVLALTELYSMNKNVSFLYLHNLGVKGVDTHT